MSSMLKINKNQNNNELILTLEGSIDSATSATLEEELKNIDRKIKTLRLDFTNVDYIASAGLRVLLVAQKAIQKQGGDIVVYNPNKGVIDVFTITGFINVINIE